MRPTPTLLSSSLLLRTLRTPLSKPPTSTPTTTTSLRPFHLPSLSSLTSGSSSPFSTPPPRTLTATRTLPHPPTPLFRTISSVDSYSQFLPFLSASTVTARDKLTNYPTRAFLTVGYGGFQETFTSEVECVCDPGNGNGKWVVEARSGRGVDEQQGKDGKEGEGLFEYLNTRWELFPVDKSARKGQQGGGVVAKASPPVETKVQLEIQFRFRSAIHAAVMSAVEDRVAAMMIEAFEKRMKELEGR
ncbi:hypothetical protein FQN54_003803 [Arachnomyces sp. PD_36]|nr:hypothetical protein FQN54_003803 [Arachnomyces sp. PD_36]